MEGLNKKMINNRLPPVWPGMRTLPISPVPLAPGSYPVWKSNEPHFKSHGGASTGIEIPFKPLDGKATALSLVGHEKYSQNSSPPWPSKDLGVPRPVAPAAAGAGHDQVRLGRNLDPNSDHKRFKRILSNRVSAQRCRLKKLEHVRGLEKKVRDLEAQIACLSPQVAIQRSNHQLLKMEHTKLNQELLARTSFRILIEAEIKRNQAEVNRLRELHSSQQQEKLHGITPVWEERFEETVDLNLNQSGMGLMGSMTIKQEPIGQEGLEMEKLDQLDIGGLEQQMHCFSHWSPVLHKQMVSSSLFQPGSPSMVPETAGVKPKINSIGSIGVAPVKMEKLNELDVEELDQQMPYFGNWNRVLHNQMVSSSLIQSGSPLPMPEPVDTKPKLANIGKKILNFDFKYSN